MRKLRGLQQSHFCVTNNNIKVETSLTAKIHQHHTSVYHKIYLQLHDLVNSCIGEGNMSIIMVTRRCSSLFILDELFDIQRDIRMKYKLSSNEFSERLLQICTIFFTAFWMNVGD